MKLLLGLAGVIIPAVAIAATVTIPTRELAGDWITQDRSAVVRIVDCGESLCGTVERVLEMQPGIPDTDVHNPNPALRSRPILGLTILSGFSRSSMGWGGGRIYDPMTGKTYSARLQMNPDGTLRVSGCVAIICQTQRWTPAR